jgi:hypothetical protein
MCPRGEGQTIGVLRLEGSERGCMLTWDLVPNEGTTVITADGEKLGTVGEIQGSYFKVEAAMRSDYWLPTTIVSSVSSSDGVTILSVLKSFVDEYKFQRPRAA